MLNISSTHRLLLYQEPIKMNKSFEGLSAAVEQAQLRQPLEKMLIPS